MSVSIAIVGDFNPQFHSHIATNAALAEVAKRLGLGVRSKWVPTTQVEEQGPERALGEADAVFASPGSPYRSFSGMLRAIEYARTRKVAFAGTGGGFQHTLLEYARNVLKFADADSAEHGTDSKNIIISPVACALPNRAGGAPKLSGGDQILLIPGTRLYQIYGGERATEEYFCNYEVNSAYEAQFREAGLIVSARGASGEVRAVEIADHPFFLATLFQPQLSSRAAEHPLIAAYLEAAAACRVSRMASA